MAAKKLMYKSEHITRNQVEDLRERMRRHTSVDCLAVCVVTARELQLLLDTIEDVISALGEKLD